MRIASLAAAVTAVTAVAASAHAAAAAPPFLDRGRVLLGVTAASAQRYEVEGLDQVVASFSTELALSVVLGGGWTGGAGALLGYGRASSGGGDLTAVTTGLEARAGHVTPLGPLASWWPQLGVGYARTTASSSDPAVVLDGSSKGALLVDLDMPLVLHPGPHLFVAAGPGLQARFSSDSQTAALLGRLSFGWRI